jgi:hypothetical protein
MESNHMARTARIERSTKESSVLVELNLDGTGQIDIETGVPFFDHMLSQLGRHGGFDLMVRTKGDVDVDSHHTVEDTSLAVGEAIREALGGFHVGSSSKIGTGAFWSPRSRRVWRTNFTGGVSRFAARSSCRSSTRVSSGLLGQLEYSAIKDRIKRMVNKL